VGKGHCNHQPAYSVFLHIGKVENPTLGEAETLGELADILLSVRRSNSFSFS